MAVLATVSDATGLCGAATSFKIPRSDISSMILDLTYGYKHFAVESPDKCRPKKLQRRSLTSPPHRPENPKHASARQLEQWQISQVRQKCGFNRFLSKWLLDLEDRLEERLKSRPKIRKRPPREVRMYGTICVHAKAVPESCQSQWRQRDWLQQGHLNNDDIQVLAHRLLKKQGATGYAGTRVNASTNF